MRRRSNWRNRLPSNRKARDKSIQRTIDLIKAIDLTDMKRREAMFQDLPFEVPERDS